MFLVVPGGFLSFFMLFGLIIMIIYHGYIGEGMGKGIYWSSHMVPHICLYKGKVLI